MARNNFISVLRLWLYRRLSEFVIYTAALALIWIINDGFNSLIILLEVILTFILIYYILFSIFQRH